MKKDEFQFEQRRYIHFDFPLGLESAWRLASNSARVARHSFYPLIGYQTAVQRFVREDGERVRKEKIREIKVCAHSDAAIYSFYSQVLSEKYEALLVDCGLGKCVSAFRGKSGLGSNIECANEVFEFVRANRPCVAFALDVSKFFDTLDHTRLKEKWAEVLGVSRLPADHFAVFRSLTQFCWVDRAAAYKALGISIHNPRGSQSGKVRRRLCLPAGFRNIIRDGDQRILQLNPELASKRGIPQGAPISSVLSNMYMLDFDKKVSTFAAERGGIYRRYCDDIMVVVPEAQKEGVWKFIHACAAEAVVKINDDKSHVVSFPADPSLATDEVLQYLGFNFDGERVTLRLSSLDRYYSKMRAGVNLARQTQRKANWAEQEKGEPLSALKLEKLYRLYSYLYKRRRKKNPSREAKTLGNFLTYAYKAARIMKSDAIKKQVRSHWQKLLEEIEKPIPAQLRGP